MILNFLMEDINNPKLDKEYKNNYSDLTEDEFLTLVKMDPSSYPRVGKDDFNLQADPIGVGNLASGGKAGLLIRCYRNGEKDFINNFKEVQDACLKYLKNRGTYSIKNAGQFPSVKDFIEYVKADGNLELNVANNETKKENGPLDKLEQLRQKQFPKIENVEKLIEIANLDPDSDVEHGQVGNLAKSLLLPHYNNGDTKFLNKKNSIRKAILAYSNASEDELKLKPLSKYMEKEGNNFKYKIIDFIMDWYSVALGQSNFSDLLEHYAVEGKEYEWVCDTSNYQVIKFWSKHVGYIVDYCDIPIEVLQKKYGEDKDAPDKWATKVGNSYYEADKKENMVTNCWCTGWGPGHTGEDHLRSYFNTNTNSLFTFIKKNRVPFIKDNTSNWLVSITNSNGYINDIADGTDVQGRTNTHIRNFQNMLRQNKDVLLYLLRYPAVQKCDEILEVAKELNVTVNDAKDGPERYVNMDDWENKVEKESEPFIYTSPSDIEKYKNNNGDPALNGIEDLVIAEGVTSIPDFLFQNCTNLRKITFPKSLIKIGNKSFANCKSLMNIKLPENLEEIGLGAFEGCSSLRGSIRLPISLKKINQNAFAAHNKKGIKFVISPKKLDADNFSPLWLPEEDHDFWFTPGRIKFSDN